MKNRMKNRIKRLLCLGCSVLMLCGTAAGCSGGKTVEYDIPEYEDQEMYIGVYNCPIMFDYYNPDRMRELKEAGVNLLISPSPASQIMLDNAHAEGLKVLSREEWFSGGKHALADHPAYMGVQIKDEPNHGEFERLKETHDAFKAAMPADKLYYVNLYPSYAPPSLLGGTYEKYINDYIETVKPPMVSFDHYALLIDQDTGGVNIRSGFFTDLETVGYACKNHDVPMWYVLLSSGHFGTYTAPTVAEMRWQMAVAMSFGAKALTHYSYQQEDATYISMTDFRGNRTEMFDRVAAANSEIRKWDNVYLAFDWIGARAIGGRNGDMDSKLQTLQHSIAMEDIDGLSKITASEDALLGAFKDADGRAGFLLTNATNPCEERINVATVEFSADKKYKAVMVYEKGEPRIIPLIDNAVRIQLDAGEGKFMIPLTAK